MKKGRFFESAATAGLLAGAVLAAPAAAHHDDDCETWSGAPVAETGGIRVDAQTVRWFDRCDPAPGISVRMADGSRTLIVLRPHGLEATRTEPRSTEPQSPQPEPAKPAREKSKPRCKKKQKGSKRSARKCRR